MGLGIALIHLALRPPGNYSVDGESMLAVARSLAERLSFAVPCDALSRHGQDGACYSVWYPLMSVLMAPFVLLGGPIGRLAGVPTADAQELMALSVPALATAGAAALTCALAIALGSSRRGAVLSACAFAFGTEALTYSRTLFAESLGAFCVAAVVWGLLGTGRRRAIGLAAVVLTILAKPQLVLVGPGVGLALALADRDWRQLARPALVTLAGGLLYLAYNVLRFSSGTDFGGPSRDVAAHALAPLSLLEGAAVLVVSPGNGLLLYGPVAAFGVVLLWRHRRDRVAAACLGGVVAVLAFYCIQPYGNAWGTRYLVPALPLACASLGLARGRGARVAVVLAVLGAVSQLPNLVAYYERSYLPGDRTWSISGMQLVAVWPSALDELRDASRADPAQLVRAGQTSPANDALVRTVAQWWWLLPAAGVPAAAGLALALIIIAAGIALLVRAARGPPPRTG